MWHPQTFLPRWERPAHPGWLGSRRRLCGSGWSTSAGRGCSALWVVVIVFEWLNLSFEGVLVCCNVEVVCTYNEGRRLYIVDDKRKHHGHCLIRALPSQSFG